jgi:hypothetical protein
MAGRRCDRPPRTVAVIKRLLPGAVIEDAEFSATFAEKWKFQSNTLA